MYSYFIDTHAHLSVSDFAEDIDLVIQRALQSNVKRFILPSTDREYFEPLLALANRYPTMCYPTVGLHPTSVKEDYRAELDFVKQQLERHTFVAIGEIGIDCYWSTDFINEQLVAFEQQLEWAVAYRLPVIIHSRESYQYIFPVLEKFENKGLSGVFHCFSGTVSDYHTIKSLGDFKVGIGGVLTFKKSPLPQVVSEVDINDIVLETDAPYLAPTPYRGKRNESAYIPIIAQRLAEVKGVTLDEIADITTKNALQLFWRNEPS